MFSMRLLRAGALALALALLPGVARAETGEREGPREIAHLERQLQAARRAEPLPRGSLERCGVVGGVQRGHDPKTSTHAVPTPGASMSPAK